MNASILQAFLDAGPNAHLSGESLAEKLGISRVAVHSRIKKLELSGIRFQATPRTGYQLVDEPERLHQDLLSAYIEQGNVALKSAMVLPSIDSTNLEVERRLAYNEPTPFAIMAHQQTHGRGRLGRSWQSSHDGNLYMSLGFRPETATTAIAPFSLWAGVHIANALKELLGIPVQVKWPNDLHVEGKKVAGILCEAKLELDRVQTLVFGFGLNVNQDASTFPEGLRTPADSLKSILGKAAPIHSVATTVLHAVLHAYEACQQPEAGVALKNAFGTVDALCKKVVEVQTGTQTISGTANGIDEDGNLLVVTAEESTIQVSAGDVTLKPCNIRIP